MRNLRPANLKRAATATIKSTARRFGLEIVRAATLNELLRHAHIGRNIESFLRVLKTLHGDHNYPVELIQNLRYSTSQFRQDLFALSEAGYKKNGYFVEIGAADGLNGSNTYLLEKVFGWTGILAEPARVWHKALRANRTAHIETCCVWSRSNVVLPFDEVEIAELSTVGDRDIGDVHRKHREKKTRYDVTTISLNELLAKYGAPEVIDFLSIDTEGTELEILKAFDFGRYRFNAVVCEHNFTALREPIAALLGRHGYLRKHQDLSGVDDWYVRSR